MSTKRHNDPFLKPVICKSDKSAFRRIPYCKTDIERLIPNYGKCTARRINKNLYCH